MQFLGRPKLLKGNSSIDVTKRSCCFPKYCECNFAWEREKNSSRVIFERSGRLICSLQCSCGNGSLAGKENHFDLLIYNFFFAKDMSVQYSFQSGYKLKVWVCIKHCLHYCRLPVDEWQQHRWQIRAIPTEKKRRLHTVGKRLPNRNGKFWDWLEETLITIQIKAFKNTPNLIRNFSTKQPAIELSWCY